MVSGRIILSSRMEVDMHRHRYMVVEHPVENEQHDASKKFEEFVLPIHTMLGTYHWMRLDDKHVFVTGNYEVSNHHTLHNHPKVSVLPIVSSGKSLKKHITKEPHWNALAFGKLTLSEDATASDAVEAAEAAFGPLFGSEK
jgi:hypothetical protein